MAEGGRGRRQKKKSSCLDETLKVLRLSCGRQEKMLLYV